MPTLDWVNKSQALEATRAVPIHLLKAEATFGDADARDNLLIQGDNLLALKALLPVYAGRVKCIFIDPPYNTQSAFEHYDDKLEHSQWLSMMLPRLTLLRELLAEDGSIWVTIDDNEAHYLKVLMDQVFGRGCFVTTFIWKKVDSPNDNKVPITPDHEYLLCFTKAPGARPFRQKYDDSILAAYRKPDAESDRPYRDRLLKKNGKNSLRSDRPSMYFPLIAPDGTEVLPIHDDGREARWAMGKSAVDELIAKDELIWKKRETGWVPYTREFAPDSPSRPYPTIWNDLDTTRQTKAHQKTMFGEGVFDTPKPEGMLKRILDMSTNPSDLVLDSFLGSGTTAAVAHKMGRRWIGIEMGEHARTHCIPRLEKVIAGEQGGISEAVDWKGGGGFRFCTLGEPAFDADGRINPDLKFATLASFIWHYETATPAAGKFHSPLLGVHGGTAYYLLYNGILGDLRPRGGNVLTRAVMAMLQKRHPHDGPKVIYGEVTRLGDAALAAANATFKQIPYDIKAR